MIYSPFNLTRSSPSTTARNCNTRTSLKILSARLVTPLRGNQIYSQFHRHTVEHIYPCYMLSFLNNRSGSPSKKVKDIQETSPAWEFEERSRSPSPLNSPPVTITYVSVSFPHKPLKSHSLFSVITETPLVNEF